MTNPEWEFKPSETDYVPPSGPRGDYTYTDEVGLKYRVYTSYGSPKWSWYVMGVLTPGGFSLQTYGDAANAIEGKVRAELAGQHLRALGVQGRIVPSGT